MEPNNQINPETDLKQSYNPEELSFKQKGWSDYASDAWDWISSLSLLSPEHRVYKLEEEKDRYKEETGYTVANDPDGVIRGLLNEQAFSVSLDPSGRGSMIGSLSKKSSLPKITGEPPKTKTLPQKIKESDFQQIKPQIPMYRPTSITDPALGIHDKPLNVALDMARTERHIIPDTSKGADGHFQGAPKDMNTQMELRQMREHFDYLVDDGLVGWDWGMRVQDDIARNNILRGHSFGYKMDDEEFSHQEYRFMDYETVLAVDRANQRNLGGRSDWTAPELQAMASLSSKGRGLFAKNPDKYGNDLQEAMREAVKTVAKPIFTSPGQKAAADIAKETIPANKVRSQLEGRGVNKDEMEWTGFNEWIKTKKGEVSKAEIEEFFAQNQIEVREVVRGEISHAQKEKIATDEVLHDLQENYRDRIIENIVVKQQNVMKGGINDPAVLEAHKRIGSTEENFIKWDDMTMQQKQGFARKYRRDNDLPGGTELDRIADANKQYDDLLEKWGSGEINEAEMNQLDEMFEGVGSYYDGEMQRTVVPEGSFVDRMYQNTLAEIEAGTYPIEHLNIPRDALPVKFGDKSWQLPGGENYRELLLMVPPEKIKQFQINNKKTGEIIPFQYSSEASAQKQIDAAIESPYENWTKKDFEVVEVEGETKPRYTGGHYPEDDVVAHIRFNERVDPDGNKVLFIEEIQGDWAHKGQEMGFHTPETQAAWTKRDNIKMRQNVIRDELREYDASSPYGSLGVEGQKELDEVTAQMNKWSAEWANTGPIPEWAAAKGNNLTKKAAEIRKTYDPNYAKKQALREELDLLNKEYDEIKDKVTGRELQRGPFVTDTHQWTNLALKRMIRWGSDNGFDSIAWVTGRQSAERYKASKLVDEISYRKNDDGTYLLLVKPKDSEAALDTISGQSMKSIPEEKLQDFVGKDIANKIVGNEGDPFVNMAYLSSKGKETAAKDINFKKLSDVDLEVGGEYHKLIYDEVLTAQAKKIGKKHGAKVEEGSIGAKGQDLEVRERGTSVQHDAGEWYVWDKDYNLIIDQKYYKTQGEAVRALDTMKRLGQSTKEGGKVWTMRLTDKLKQASKEGMPYYVVLPPLVIGAALLDRNDSE